MKKSTMYFLCFFFSLLFAIAHAVPLRDSGGAAVNSKEIKSEEAKGNNSLQRHNVTVSQHHN